MMPSSLSPKVAILVSSMSSFLVSPLGDELAVHVVVAVGSSIVDSKVDTVETEGLLGFVSMHW